MFAYVTSCYWPLPRGVHYTATVQWKKPVQVPQPHGESKHFTNKPKRKGERPLPPFAFMTKAAFFPQHSFPITQHSDANEVNGQYQTCNVHSLSWATNHKRQKPPGTKFVNTGSGAPSRTRDWQKLHPQRRKTSERVNCLLTADLCTDRQLSLCSLGCAAIFWVAEITSEIHHISCGKKGTSVLPYFPWPNALPSRRRLWCVYSYFWGAIVSVAEFSACPPPCLVLQNSLPVGRHLWCVRSHMRVAAIFGVAQLTSPPPPSLVRRKPLIVSRLLCCATLPSPCPSLWRLCGVLPEPASETG